MKHANPDSITKQLYINGQWQSSTGQKQREILNPATGEVICSVVEANRDDTVAAIQAARQAFETDLSYRANEAERKKTITRLADAIEKDKPRLAELESLDTGKPVAESYYDIDDVVDVFRYYANLVGDETQLLETNIPRSESKLVREPVGVCGMICPWNYPLLQASWKVAPALAAGCTMVLKPSELTPLTSLRLAELVHEEAGLSAGIFNLVTGAGHDVGAELSESPDVDLISFTGGVQTGRRIMQAASSNIKKVALELGGKNPHIIFDDANLDNALEAILNGVFYHAGQICSAGSRLMLQAGIHDEIVERLAERIARIQMGGPFDEKVQMGPVISAEHRDKIESYFTIAKEEGATIVTGGSRPDGSQFSGGYYLLPTLVTGCENDMRVVQEEIFGPVITVEKFSTEEEAVSRANGTIYGLSAGFFTADKERADRVSRALRFGTVWVNDFNIYLAAAPWGGYKQSGIGRELGPAGLDEYQEIKHIYTNQGTNIDKVFGVE